ncbi:MAG: phosphatidate cytidylyltransferase [Dehalococcoidia bacterium]|nr:phosphatidate cytidylyltransferase [Dehalococcoidia bacterium]
MLKQRLAVAAVGLPLLALLVASPERVFGLGVALILGAATYEVVHAAIPATTRTSALAAGVLAALLATSFRTLEEIPVWSLPAMVAVTLLLLALLLWPGPGQAPAGAWWLGAVLYLGVLGAHWLLLRNEDHGQAWVVVAFAVTFATDTGAYAVGRLVGRHLFWPAVSPKKTWEGAGGAVVFGGAMAAGLPFALGIQPEWPWVVAIAATLPLAAIAGDLLESALKRRLDVKDMSHLLPGHGGLLDRLDSLLLTGPLLYWLLQGAQR